MRPWSPQLPPCNQAGDRCTRTAFKVQSPDVSIRDLLRTSASAPDPHGLGSELAQRAGSWLSHAPTHSQSSFYGAEPQGHCSDPRCQAHKGDFGAQEHGAEHLLAHTGRVPSPAASFAWSCSSSTGVMEVSIIREGREGNREEELQGSNGGWRAAFVLLWFNRKSRVPAR